MPRPDTIVAISGCHYEGGQLDLFDTEAWGNKEADILLLVKRERRRVRLGVAFTAGILLATDNRTSIMMGEQGRPFGVKASYDFRDG